jgi:TetR/AcrR family transcriptional repressor of nem operon
MGNLALELSDVHEGFRQRLAASFEVWRLRLSETLARGQASGRLTPACNPAALGQFVVAALEGAILLTKVTKDIAVMEKCVEQVKEHLTLYTDDPLDPHTTRAGEPARGRAS